MDELLQLITSCTGSRLSARAGADAGIEQAPAEILKHRRALRAVREKSSGKGFWLIRREGRRDLRAYERNFAVA